MAVVIDTLERVQAANRYLASGQGTEDEQDQVRTALKERTAAIELGADDSYGWKRTLVHSTMSDSDKALAAEINAEKLRIGESRKAPPSILATGPGTAVLEVGEALTDILGYEDGSNFFQGKQEELADWTKEGARDIRRKAYGRGLTASETASVDQHTEDQLAGATFASELALGGFAGRAAAAGKGLLAHIAIGSAEGAALGGLLVGNDEEDFDVRRGERFSSMLWGAALGGGIGVVTGTFATVRNTIANQTGKFREGSEEAFKLADEFDVPLDLGSATGSPVVQAVQAGAASTKAAEFFARQADRLPKAIAEKIGVALPSLENVGRNLEGRMGNAFQALEQTVEGMKAAGAAAWKQSVKRARAAGGETVQMDVRALQGQLKNVMSQMANKNVAAGEGLKVVMTEINEAAARGGATIDDIDRWWLRINNFKASPTGSSFAQSLTEGVALPSSMEPTLSTLTGQLSRTLKNSIEGATGSKEALAVLKQGRDRWSEGQKIVQELTDDVLKPLGFGSTMTPVSALNALDDIPEATLRRAAAFIRKRPDGAMAMRQIRETLFEASVNVGLGKGGGTQAVATGNFNIEKWVNAFKDNNLRARGVGLMTEREAANAAKGLQLARTILNAGQAGKLVQHKIVNGLEAWTINAISRNPAFAGRLLASTLSRGKGADALFFTDEGLQILRNLQPKAIQNAKTAMARNMSFIWLAGMLSDGAKEKHHEDMERQQQEKTR